MRLKYKSVKKLVEGVGSTKKCMLLLLAYILYNFNPLDIKRTGRKPVTTGSANLKLYSSFICNMRYC